MAKNKLEAINDFHQTKKGRITFGLIELVLAYISVSLAIDSGSILQYVIAMLLAIGGANNLSYIIRQGNKNAKKRANAR